VKRARVRVSQIEQTRNSNTFKKRRCVLWRLARNERLRGRLAGRAGRHGAHIPKIRQTIKLPHANLKSSLTAIMDCPIS
jgi:hypothetical protein